MTTHTRTPEQSDERPGEETTPHSHVGRIDHGAHAERPALTERYRRQYEKLPPALQMIGLQLWLPLVFVVAFCLCYVFAFHAPSPKDLPVAIVGPQSSASALAGNLQGSAGDTLDVTVRTDEDAARDAVRSGELVAAYVPAAQQQGGTATLIVASAANYQLEAVAKATFAPVAAATGATLTADDLAPLPSHDSYGTALFYLALVWTIGGYMVAMFVGLMGVMLRHRTRAAIIVAGGLVTSLLSNLLVFDVVGAVEGHFWPLVGLGWATTVAIGSVVNGLAYFLGRYVTGAALLLFVFLNIPASGGAYPPEFVPQPFAWLHHVVAGAGVIEALRRVVYGVGPSVWTGLAYLGGYLLLGIVLSVLGKQHLTRRQRNRAAKGKRPSMMIVAQQAAMAAGAAAATQSGSGARSDDGEDELELESDVDAVASGSVAP